MPSDILGIDVEVSVRVLLMHEYGGYDGYDGVNGVKLINGTESRTYRHFTYRVL